ncbi:MAG: response regulator transcription factor [Planctomycetes bacterium]|nr:response regulator transcription factor [Planctomycetota bacterium]
MTYPSPLNSLKTTFFRVLSKREREVAALVANGLSNKEIAKQLFISPATVKDHVHNILTTSGLANRTAIAAAYRGHDTSSDATT